MENNSAFEGNTAIGIRNAFGGAICIAGGTANISGSFFGNGNAALESGWNGGYLLGNAYGGAIYVGGGTVTLNSDTVGNLINFGVPSNTASGLWINSYNKGYGGGLCVAGGTVTLRNDSITGNDAGSSNSIGYGGGIFIASGAQVYLDSFTWANTTSNYISGYYQQQQLSPFGSGVSPGSYGNINGICMLLPQIGSFTASPNPVTAGTSLALTASNIRQGLQEDGNPIAPITQVSFYYFDSSGAEHILGNGTQTSTGVWTLTVKANLAPGTYTLYAQAEDSSGLFSDPVALTLTVQ